LFPPLPSASFASPRTMQKLMMISATFHLALAGMWPSNLLLSKHCSHGLFDQLPDFDDAVEAFDSLPAGKLDHVLNNLRQTAGQHGVESVMLGLKHKHFDMSPDHFLGDELSSSSNFSLMKPREKSLLPEATPISFTLEEGLWQPYEWALDNSQAAESFDLLQGKQQFLQNITDFLVSEQLDGMFGLHIKHREDWEDSFGTVESPGDGEQELHIRPARTANHPSDEKNLNGMNAESRTVAWPLSGPQINQWCSGHNVQCMKHARVCNAHWWR